MSWGDLPIELRALAAVTALVLLPGLTVVRAPWTAVPCLSLSFWLVSWWWLAPLGATRGRFVHAALLFFAALAALRLLKPLPRLRPGLAAASVATAALAQLLPFRFLSLPAEEDGPLRGLTVQLLVWRDGLPRTYEPLAPVHSFGAALRGTDLLAADVALLSGLTPTRAAVMAACVGAGVLLLGMQALLLRVARERAGGLADAAARLAAASVLAWLVLAGGLAAWRGSLPAATLLAGGGALGGALFVSAAGLLLHGRTRAPAVAAGLFLAGALVSEPLLLALALPALALIAAARLAATPPAGRVGESLRLGLATATAAGLSAPAALAFDLTLSAGERAALGPLVLSGEHAAALCLVGGLACVARLASGPAGRAPAPGGLAPRGAWLVVTALLALLATAWSGARARPRTPPAGARELAALHERAAAVGLTESVCIDPGTADVWIPALAGRAVEPSVLPGFYADELRTGFARRSCRKRRISQPIESQ